MQFEVGDTVVHPTYGIGHVVGIEELSYLGADARPFYVISIENGTIWVPQEETKEIHLRPIISKRDLDACRALLRDTPSPLNEDRYQRSSDNNLRLKTATFQTLCEIVRDLNAFGWKKKLNEYDGSTFRKALTSMVQEWALSAGISNVAADAEIKAILQESRLAYLSPESTRPPR